ncbi:MAG: formate C-acetyltransferase [Planctomycetota bacterium]|nr:MAG: formate C-acetyltransferase [Planctomycetota bacterium]
MSAWQKFQSGNWCERIDVPDFIVRNYTPYEGDEAFLAGPSARTNTLMEQVEALLRAEREAGGVLDIDTTRATSVTAHPPGYINQDQEVIYGLQTDAPLKRAVNPYGGLRMAVGSCQAYDREFSPELVEIFSKYRRTHNEGVFRAYDAEVLAARRCGIVTGLPDAYGRGRIIGDYRRVALYGTQHLIATKEADKARLSIDVPTAEQIQLLEEISDQIDALKDLTRMAADYGDDISVPAASAREAVQWVYYGYLAAVKQQNGAAMSLGRVSTFLDIYIERDCAAGVLDEEQAQELIDQFVMKLRLTRQLRTPEYDELFAGDPTWVTESIAGVGNDGRHQVTRTSYRFLHTLYNLKPSPEPNLTVLWSEALPVSFKRYCAKVSIETGSIQYENDDLMRPRFGDDCAIACCVSAMQVGKQMQFFGARANLAKLLLMALNGGKDEISGVQVGPVSAPVGDGPLDFGECMNRWVQYLDWLCRTYVKAMNIIHFMHDKYAYESLQMALHDSEVERLIAYGIAGLSVLTDSLSAIKHATVTPVRDERGIIVDFTVEGDYPCYGNDDDRVDEIAVDIVRRFHETLSKYPTYRNAKTTLSVLTITSNVVNGKKTGSTPDGRKLGEPFAPGANPMHRRDRLGAIASMNSVAKLPYDCCLDGISNTSSYTPQALGPDLPTRIDNLVGLLDGYFIQQGHHLNVNVYDADHLKRAMEHPEEHPNLTIRVSGYAVNFHRLTRAQQEEVISRTFHGSL